MGKRLTHDDERPNHSIIDQMDSSPRSISRLRLTAFRNYASAALDLDHRPVVLTGPNGAGKTNLLEAISLLSPGRGMLRAPFEELTQNGSGTQWAVAATIETPEGPVDIGTGAGEGGRRVRINGANARLVEEMSDYVRILWLTPAMDALFAGPSSDRRRVLARLVTTLIPGHGATVAAYEKATRERNRLLEDNADPVWLTAIEAQMAEHASAIHFARTDSLGQLQTLAESSVDEENFPAALLRLTPLLEGEVPNNSNDLEAELAELWASTRALDRAAGRTTIGPHRADLDVSHAQKSQPAHLCSTGEQKALLTGLVLAHARLVAQAAGIAPFLLLDEIAAHFDPARRSALFEALGSLDAQCWMTGADTLLFDAWGIRAQWFSVEAGRVRPKG
jgi:DNA replication and repair protein RecF